MLKLKFYFPFSDSGWSGWVSIFCASIAGGCNSGGEVHFELMAGEASMDYSSGSGWFNVQAAIGYSAWALFAFDGEQFKWGGGI